MPIAIFIPIIHHFRLLGWTPLLIYLAGIAAFLLSVFWRPYIGIYFIVPLYPLQTFRYRVFQYPWGYRMPYIVLLGVILGAMFQKGYKVIHKNPLNKPLLIFFVLLYISLWYGSAYLQLPLPYSLDNPRFENWVNYMIMPVTMVLVTAVIRDVNQIKTLFWLLCGSCLLAARSVYNAVADRSLGSFTYDIRDGGVFGGAGANGAGAFFAWFSVMLIAVAVFTKKRSQRWALLGLASWCIYDLMLTFSRGAYLACLVGISVLAIIKERRILLLLIPFLFTWQLIVPGAVRDRVLMTYDSSDHQLDGSAQGRVNLWEDGIRFVQDNPVFGTGYNTYPYLHHLESYVNGMEINDPHNYYLKIVIETGFIGLMFFLAILWGMFRIGWRLYKRAREPILKGIALGLMPAILAVAVANLFGDRWEYLQTAGLLWALVGCAVRGLMLSQVTAEEKPVEVVEEPAELAPELASAYRV